MPVLKIHSKNFKMSNQTNSGNILIADDTNDLNDTLQDVDEVGFSPQKKTRGKARKYILHKFFLSIDEAEREIADNFLNNVWIHKKTTDTAKGQTRWYNCKQKSCEAKLQLILNQAIDGCTLLYSDDEHVHNESRSLISVGIDQQTKDKIKELEALGLKPSAILIQLRSIDTKIPTILQLNNFLKETRKASANKNGTAITLNDIVSFLIL